MRIPALPRCRCRRPGSGPLRTRRQTHSGTSSETGTSTSTGTQADDAPRKPKESGVEGIVVPLVRFNTDFGFGYGGVGGMYVYGPGYVPYRYGLALQASNWTTRGIQNHFLHRCTRPDWSAPDRGPGGVPARAASPFFGLGNDSSPDFSGHSPRER